MAEIIDMFTATATYHGVGLGGHDPAEAYAAAATELRYPGYLAADDKRPPNEYATHNMVLRALGTYAKRARIRFPIDARCEIAHCLRLRIPGFKSCHWHGASVTPDDEILEAMLTEIGVN